jgi:activator of 2-hydroxyglutaryl-CoA dehydratase/predicted nucleotide-binding protein (sugar kinase/HSP70/actin superfamily)
MTENLPLSDADVIQLDQCVAIFIDAGIRTLRITACGGGRRTLANWFLPSNQDIQHAFARIGLTGVDRSIPVYMTGKLRDVVHGCIGHGEKILPAAALWAAVENQSNPRSIAVLEISASGYTALGVDAGGKLKDNLLAANARCGAGSGINIDRVLQKLAISRSDVDSLLGRYLGPEGETARRQIHVRADRCGVFASSATVSDKNQGIPIDFALAVTLKSEVVKACKKITPGFDTVWLTGGVFGWRFARDCARDFIADMGVTTVAHDRDGDLPIRGLMRLEKKIGRGGFIATDRRIVAQRPLAPLPPFQQLKEELTRDGHYHRHADRSVAARGLDAMRREAVFIGLDVGSTMAKVVISTGAGKEMLYKGAYSNAGDTIETIKTIFKEIQDSGLNAFQVKKIGITGSARYQVQKALANIYPQLTGRINVLVENYAHARGAIDYVRGHIARLKAAGVGNINEKRCILVDVGGEDTKISTIDLDRAELFDNAMNIKCSAGTGSLLDAMGALFNIPEITTVSRMAMSAPGAFSINATCAVFLMENAIRLQAEGVPREQILASAVWAIVENMAHSLWNQLSLPKNAVVLLHGQTMRGMPLTLATASRLQRHIGAPAYCLVPPDPGHRACIGLINSMDAGSMDAGDIAATTIRLDDFIGHRFRKRIVQCRGAACGDASARCNRSHLSSVGGQARNFSFTLGGCTAVNELQGSGRTKTGPATDTYRQIWNAMDAAQARSDDPDRLVIPRSFSVSEWAFFFSRLFTPVGIPVHVDNVNARDISRAQSTIHIDTCAPQIGAVGQMMRLAGEPHGIILAPQIEFLPTRGNSLGRTCTINQGGMAVAKNLAAIKNPHSRIFLFHLSLKGMSPDDIAHQIYPRLAPIYAHYHVNLPFDTFRKLVNDAWQAQELFRHDIAETAAGLAEKTMAADRSIALVVGREYVLNPGIYDSHVGRLLRDKGLAGIPGHVLDIELNPDLGHLYWKNAHFIATLADAVSRRKLHRIVLNPRFKKLFKRIEETPGADIALIQVSTFLCGPDSVTNPLINELVKNRPFLRIQSDAVIQELAHLENRMNTYVKQLHQGLHQTLEESDREAFDVRILDVLTNREPLHPETDAIYLPTLSDNRCVTSVIRGAGFTCIDNFQDTHDLQAAVKAGRAVTGDGVCAPLAAVYGDILMAIEDFKQRKRADDPQVRGKTRLLIFNNKGLGPCRQGQYVETHKLFLNQKTGNSQAPQAAGDADPLVMKFLIGRENKGFNIGFPEWAYLRCIQGIILQGVLHQLLSAGASQCSGYAEYKTFLDEYAALKKKLYTVQEHSLKPSARSLDWVRRAGRHAVWGWVVKYLAYRFYDRSLTRPLQRFANQWNRRPVTGRPMRIHLDGEVYMRIAQFEEILKRLIGTLGFRQFHLTHTPVWGFLEYKLAGSIMRTKESIAEGNAEIRRAHSEHFRVDRSRFVRKKKRQLMSLKAAYLMQRFVLARPLYRAAGLDMPEAVPHVLDEAKALIPTRRPGGELLPYLGEAVIKLKKGYDLMLNVAPEGCMVSSMGEVLTPAIVRAAPNGHGIVQPIFSQQGDVDEEKLALALLKSIGPYRLYQSNS